MEENPPDRHGDIRPGDVTVAPLPQGYGFIYGRVVDPATTPDGTQWSYLGTATHQPLACELAKQRVSPGQHVWVCDAAGGYTLYAPPEHADG
jgi:hypothetical protein